MMIIAADETASETPRPAPRPGWTPRRLIRRFPALLPAVLPAVLPALFPVLLALTMVLPAAGARAQSGDRPLLVEGRNSVYQRVLTRPGAQFHLPTDRRPRRRWRILQRQCGEPFLQQGIVAGFHCASS